MPIAINQLSDVRAAQIKAAYASSVSAKRRQTTLGLVILALLVALSGFVAEVSPTKFFLNIHNFTNYIGRIFLLENGQFVLSDPQEWFWGWKKWLKLLGETLLMAYVGTLAGAAGALVLCFLASRNLTQSSVIVWCARRFLEFLRTVPEIVFALIFVVAFGLGAVPGVLAIGIHTMGALGKLFAEVAENIDMKPVDGIKASGGSWLSQVRFGALPQVSSNFASYALLRFEINVRGAAVMGFVGAGGIGQTLLETIRKFYYSDVSAILVLIIITVMVLDTLTEIVRTRLIGAENAR